MEEVNGVVLEACAQCGAKAKEHPVAIIMKFDEAMAGAADVIAIAPGEQWMALPVCGPCHQAPRMKGHFFYRQDVPLALRLADMPSWMPGGRLTTYPAR